MIDPDPVREAVEQGPLRLVVIGGPHCGEEWPINPKWGSLTAPRKPYIRHYFHAGTQFRESNAGVPVNPRLDRRHAYTRSRWRGRPGGVLLHSCVEDIP